MNMLLAIIIIVLVVVIPSIKIVPQAKSYVIERLGSYYQTWGNGLHFKVPFIKLFYSSISQKICDIQGFKLKDKSFNCFI